MKKLLSLIIVFISIAFACVGSFLSFDNSVVNAATYTYKNFRLYDKNIYTGKTTYYNYHYYYSPKKMVLKNTTTNRVDGGWNYQRYRIDWLYY